MHETKATCEKSSGRVAPGQRPNQRQSQSGQSSRGDFQRLRGQRDLVSSIGRQSVLLRPVHEALSAKPESDHVSYSPDDKGSTCSCGADGPIFSDLQEV